MILYGRRLRVRTTRVAAFGMPKGGGCEVVYPDLRLYEEVLFLKHYYNGLWVEENVVPYYEPLIPPTKKIGRHLFWANFRIGNKKFETEDVTKITTSNYGFDISSETIRTERKDKIVRNLVNPEIGLYLLEQALGIHRANQTEQATLNFE